jgi:hypothetical protein
MAMNINFNRQKLILVFFYFSYNTISLFPPPFHLQFKMVRRANDDFILSFLTLMSIFPRAYFPSPLPPPPPGLVFLPNFISQLGAQSGTIFQSPCSSATTATARWPCLTYSLIWMNEASRNRKLKAYRVRNLEISNPSIISD